MTIFIIMGVAGTGKTTVGRASAEHLGLPFLDADDFHPPENITKMRGGTPLNETDRIPWTQAITTHITRKYKHADIVLACSALSKPTRSRLRAGLSGNCVFIHLHGDWHILKERLTARRGHMFSVDLLASQFTALQMPKRAHMLNIDQSIERLVTQICALIRP